MKKIISALLIAALVIVMSVSAFATGNEGYGTITNSYMNPEKGKEDKTIYHGDSVTFTVTPDNDLDLPEGYTVQWIVTKLKYVPALDSKDYILTPSGKNDQEILMSAWGNLTVYAVFCDADGDPLYIKSSDIRSDRGESDGYRMLYAKTEIEVKKTPANFIKILLGYEGENGKHVEGFLEKFYDYFLDVYNTFKDVFEKIVNGNYFNYDIQ